MGTKERIPSSYEIDLGYPPPKGALKDPIRIVIERYGDQTRSAYIVRRRFAHCRKEEVANPRGVKATREIPEPFVDLHVPCKTGGHSALAVDARTGQTSSGKWWLSSTALEIVRSQFAEWEKKRGGVV